MTQLVPPALRDAVQEAANGKRVIFAAESQGDTRNLFRTLRADGLLTEFDISTRATNGAEAIIFTQGGRIDFVSIQGNGYRGRWAHRVYAPTSTTDEQEAQIAPCLESARGGEFIWYVA